MNSLTLALNLSSYEIHRLLVFQTLNNIDNGEEYEILKTVKNTVIKKGSENNEEPHKAHIDTIIRSL